DHPEVVDFPDPPAIIGDRSGRLLAHPQGAALVMGGAEPVAPEPGAGRVRLPYCVARVVGSREILDRPTPGEHRRDLVASGIHDIPQDIVFVAARVAGVL